jgi:ABC-type multidrug transport system permease subunit
MSTAFMPLPLLPGWLQAIARYNPVSYLADVIRGSLAGHIGTQSLWKALLGVAIVTVFTQTLVVRAQRSRASA